MDNFAVSANYKKNNRSVETQSTVNTNITVNTGSGEGVQFETDDGMRSKKLILPPKHLLRRNDPIPGTEGRVQTEPQQT
jgi:hypothetical protein